MCEVIKNSVNQEIGLIDSLKFMGVGLNIAFSKECFMFVLIPIIVNVLVLSLGGYFTVHWILGYVEGVVTDIIPGWLSGILMWVLGFILVICLGYVSCMVFATIANIIASPFYGILAEKAETKIRGVPFVSQDDGIMDVIKDIPRILSRELRKQMFFIPRLLLCCIISLIPVINIVSPICWFLLFAWMAAIQYVDYGYDNHKISFQDMRKELWQHRMGSFGFGSVISVLMTVPVLNIFIPPIAVCAGTKFYVEAQNRYTLDTDYHGQPFPGQPGVQVQPGQGYQGQSGYQGQYGPYGQASSQYPNLQGQYANPAQYPNGNTYAAPQGQFGQPGQIGSGQPYPGQPGQPGQFNNPQR